MIKKKCNECGTLYPLNHAGACKVDGENDWSTACEKHPTLNLGGASSCQMCESERGIGEYKRKEKQWEKERSKLEKGTGADGIMPPAPAAFEFLMAPNRDIVAIKKSGTGTNSTEIHILDAGTNYQTWKLQTGTVLHETDDTFEFLMASNRDIIAVKKSGTGTNSTEIHILDTGTNYQAWRLQTGTVLHETDDTFEFLMASNRDIVAIKKSGTGTNSTEIHILDAGTTYQTWKFQTGTVLHETDDTFG